MGLRGTRPGINQAKGGTSGAATWAVLSWFPGATWGPCWYSHLRLKWQWQSSKFHILLDMEAERRRHGA